MQRNEVSMGSIYVYGEEYRVPQVLVDEFTRLRMLERQWQDERTAQLTKAWEAEHGPLPPPKPSEWALVEDYS